MRDFRRLPCSAPKVAAARALARALEDPPGLHCHPWTSDAAAPHVIANLSSRSSQAPKICKKIICEFATHGSRSRMSLPPDTINLERCLLKARNSQWTRCKRVQTRRSNPKISSQWKDGQELIDCLQALRVTYRHFGISCKNVEGPSSMHHLIVRTSLSDSFTSSQNCHLKDLLDASSSKPLLKIHTHVSHTNGIARCILEKTGTSVLTRGSSSSMNARF